MVAAAADTAAVPVAVEIEMADAGDVVGAELDEVVGAGETGDVDVAAAANVVAVGKVPAEAVPVVAVAVDIVADAGVVAVDVAADSGPVQVVLFESGADLMGVGAAGAVGAAVSVAAAYDTAEFAVAIVDGRAIVVVLVVDAALPLGLSNMVTPLVKSATVYPSAAVLIINVAAMVDRYPTLGYMPAVVPPTALLASPYVVVVAAVLAVHLALQLFRRY